MKPMKVEKRGDNPIDFIFESLRGEHSNLENELTMCRIAKDDYERKLRSQLSEFDSLKHTVADLGINHTNLLKRRKPHMRAPPTPEPPREPPRVVEPPEKLVVEEIRVESIEDKKKEEKQEEKDEKKNKDGSDVPEEIVQMKDAKTVELGKRKIEEESKEEPPKKKQKVDNDGTPKKKRPSFLNEPISMPSSKPPRRFPLNPELLHIQAPYVSMPPSGHEGSYGNVGLVPPPPYQPPAYTIGENATMIPAYSLQPAAFGYHPMFQRAAFPYDLQHKVHPPPIRSDNMFKQEGNDWVVIHTNFKQHFPKSSSLNISLKKNFDHNSVVCCVNFNSSGKYVITGGNNVTRMYEVQTGKLVKCFGVETNSKGRTGKRGESKKDDNYVRSAVFSRSGKLVFTGNEDKTVKIWDVEGGKILKSLKGHLLDVYSVVASRNSKRVISGSGDGRIKIWDVQSGATIHTFGESEHDTKEGVTSLALSPDGRTIASGSLDCIVRLWDFETGKCLENIRGHEDSVYSVAFSPNGRHLTSGSLDKTLKVWDVSQSKKSYRLIQTFGGHRDYVLSVTYSPCGNWLVSGSKDRSIQFWDMRMNVLQLMLQGHKNSVISVAMAPQGRTFGTGSGDLRCRLWNY